MGWIMHRSWLLERERLINDKTSKETVSNVGQLMSVHWWSVVYRKHNSFDMWMRLMLTLRVLHVWIGSMRAGLSSYRPSSGTCGNPSVTHCVLLSPVLKIPTLGQLWMKLVRGNLKLVLCYVVWYDFFCANECLCLLHFVDLCLNVAIPVLWILFTE